MATTKKQGRAANPQRPPTSSGIVESPTKKPPDSTILARERQTAYLKARMAREMRHNPPGLGGNSGQNTGGVSEGGMVSPYTLT